MFKKTQEQLNAEFLNAVARHNFTKAKKLLEHDGADINTVDTCGNNVLHKLAAAGILAEEDVIDANICFFLNKNIDINARNDAGETCLHFAAALARTETIHDWNYCATDDALIRILLNRGADPNAVDARGKTPLHFVAEREGAGEAAAKELIKGGAQVDITDKAGQMPLHIAASQGKKAVVNVLLAKEPALIAVKDKKSGLYPHECAVSGPVGYHALSRQLLKAFGEFNAEKAPVSVPAPEDPWHLLPSGKVEHVEETSRYRLTEIFNFSRRTYTLITFNKETERDDTLIRGFDEFPDKTIFVEAHRELTRRGGKVEESAIYGAVLDKGAGKKPAPRTY